MAGYRLLMVLQDRAYERVLLMRSGDAYALPAYDQLVDANVGFDIPEPFNDFFRERTGIRAVRKYVFAYEDCIVFVMEDVGQSAATREHCAWVCCGEASRLVKEAEAVIVDSVRRNGCRSIGMPWIGPSGYAPYMKWVQETLREKGCEMIGPAVQLKNAYVSSVFQIPTDHGNWYMKIPGTVYLHEIAVTQEIMRWGIARLPQWIAVSPDLNAILMEDMTGCDLRDSADMDVLGGVIDTLARIQQDAIDHVKNGARDLKDHRISSIAMRLPAFAEEARNVLKGTKYELTNRETAQLAAAVQRAENALLEVEEIKIPATLQHGDLRPGNIRVLPGEYMLYDWSNAAVAHPFVDISQFLHGIRRTLPSDVPAKEILVRRYLKHWIAYASMEQLRSAFDLLDENKELFMAYADLCWVNEIREATGGTVDPLSADGWLLERRLYYFDRVLRRLGGFLERS